MPTFCVRDRIKARLTRNLTFQVSHASCQSPRHSKCDKISDTDTTSRRGQVLILNQKPLPFAL